MADVKPLRLKTQRVAKKGLRANENPVAQISVDSGINHLDSAFDYLVPEELSSIVVPGIFVDVPFGTKQVSGYVISRKATNFDLSKLKFITKVISPIPLLSEELLKIISETCVRYACKPWDVIRSAIPPRVAGAETNFLNKSLTQSDSPNSRPSHKVTVITESDGLLKEIINELATLEVGAQLLVIVPDERDIAQILTGDFPEIPTVLTTDISKLQRYTNYLKARFEAPRFIIGTRSSIFTPLNVNSRIVIFNDNDESMYERRNPGWNVRDIALLRGGSQSLHFVSSAPSPEVVRLTELGWIAKSPQSANVRGKSPTFHFAGGRTSDISVIKAGLKVGNVLVVMAETGYINAIACQKCKNQARCKCGGKLFVPGKNKSPRCFLCEEQYEDWECSYCREKNIRIIGKGSIRYAEEIAKSVPGFRVILSKGGSRIDFLPEVTENLLVIATYGCEPEGRYSAVVLNSLENLTNRVDLRSLEYARRVIFENLNRLDRTQDAAAYVNLASDNPVSQSVLRNDAYGLALTEIKDRESSSLPPFFRIATLVGEGSAIRELRKQLSGNQLFQQISIISHADERPSNTSLSKMILRSEIEKSAEFSEFFRDLARYRGIKGLSPIQIRLDPFSI